MCQVHPIPERTAQGGFALIFGMLLLIVMSMIGVSMMSSSSLETLMAGGAREANIAFQAAEAALRDAEARIEATTSIAAFDGSIAGQLSATDLEPDFFAAGTWVDASSLRLANDYPEIPAAGQPRYIIKHVGDVIDDSIVGQDITVRGYGEQAGRPIVSIFRVTARSASRDGSATTILQSYYGRAY